MVKLTSHFPDYLKKILVSVLQAVQSELESLKSEAESLGDDVEVSADLNKQ